MHTPTTSPIKQYDFDTAADARWYMDTCLATEDLTSTSIELPTANVHIMADKYAKGGEQIDGTTDVVDLLTQKWEFDLHFTMYTHPSVTRLVKESTPHKGIRFDVAVYDLDFDDHKTRPTHNDFCSLVFAGKYLDEAPNIIYQTRGGARFVYFIESIYDEFLFEAHYQSFLGRLAAFFETRAESYNFRGYQVDTAAKDWTRLFRASRVTRENSSGVPVPEFDYDIRAIHGGKLDLQTFKVKEKPAPPVYDGNAIYRGFDKRIITGLARLKNEGSRNQNLFKLCAYVHEKYEPNSREQIYGRIRNWAMQGGLSEKEIDSTMASAANHLIRISGTSK